jgi:site-specific recombinase XerD
MSVRKRAVKPPAREDDMEGLAVVEPAGEVSTEVRRLAERAVADAADSLAESTRRAYRHDWSAFAGWCGAHGLVPLPATAAVLATYIEYMGEEGYKAATIRRALATIRQAHRQKGKRAPTGSELVRRTLRGLLKRIGITPRKARPFYPEDFRKAFALLGTDLRGMRDRAMATLCFTGAFRRSEIVGLNVEDLVFIRDGTMTVLLRSSKTDQLGAGQLKGIPLGKHEETCPVRAVRAWLAASGITAGPLFREITLWNALTERRASDQAVHRLAKKLAKLAGLEKPELYSGHSFRAGLVTTADRAGKSITKIMEMTGHRDMKTAQGYLRDTNLFRGNAADDIGM